MFKCLWRVSDLSVMLKILLNFPRQNPLKTVRCHDFLQTHSSRYSDSYTPDMQSSIGEKVLRRETLFWFRFWPFNFLTIISSIQPHTGMFNKWASAEKQLQRALSPFTDIFNCLSRLFGFYEKRIFRKVIYSVIFTHVKSLFSLCYYWFNFSWLKTQLPNFLLWQW